MHADARINIAKLAKGNNQGGAFSMTDERFNGWRKASFSGTAANCVEVAAGRQTVGVRDTTLAGHGPVLEFSSQEWQRLVASIKA